MVIVKRDGYVIDAVLAETGRWIVTVADFDTEPETPPADAPPTREQQPDGDDPIEEQP